MPTDFATSPQAGSGWTEITHKSCNVRVYEVRYAPRSKGVRSMEEHALSLSLDHGQVEVSCQSVIPPRFGRGAVSFAPGGTAVTVIPGCEFREAVIPLPDLLFVEACRTHIDHTSLVFDFRCIRDATCRRLAQSLRSIVMNEDYREWPLLLESAMTSLVVAVIRSLSPHANRVFSDMRFGPSSVSRRRVLEYIDANLHRQMTLGELAGVCGRSKYHFTRIFSGSLGQSPLRYVTGRRVDRAKRLLQAGSDPLAHVALACGFASQSHMTTAFRRTIGVTPGEFRRRS